MKDCHRTPDPTTSSYADLVSHESIRMEMTYSAFMKLYVMAADIINSYLEALTLEGNYFICGPEFGIDNVGKVALITRALYCRKVVGCEF